MRTNQARYNPPGRPPALIRNNAGDNYANQMKRNEELKCFRCGSTTHMVKQCPHPAPICPYCHKPGHKIEDCWVKHGRPVQLTRGQNNGAGAGFRQTNFNPRPAVNEIHREEEPQDSVQDHNTYFKEHQE